MPVRHQPSTLIIPETITISLSYSVLGDLCNTSDFCLWETRFEKIIRVLRLRETRFVKIIRVLRRGKHGSRNSCEFSAAEKSVGKTHPSFPLRETRLEIFIRVLRRGKLGWKSSSEFSGKPAGNSIDESYLEFSAGGKLG